MENETCIIVASLLKSLQIIRDVAHIRFCYPKIKNEKQLLSILKEVHELAIIFIEHSELADLKSEFDKYDFFGEDAYENTIMLMAIILLKFDKCVVRSCKTTDHKDVEGFIQGHSKNLKRFGEIRETLLNIQIFHCQFPSIDDDPIYQETSRYIYLLDIYWSKCEVVINERINAFVGYSSHPLMQFLLNLKQRVEFCFLEVCRFLDTPESREAKENAELLIDTLIFEDHDVLSFIDAEATAKVRAVRVFIDQLKMTTIVAGYSLTIEEQMFISSFDSNYKEYSNNLKNYWNQINKNTEKENDSKKQQRNYGLSQQESGSGRKNLFRLEGENWRIRFQGTACGTFKNSIGLRIIAHLLQHPDQHFLVSDLKRIATPPPPAVANVELENATKNQLAELNLSIDDSLANPTMDSRYNSEIKAELQKLQDRIEDAEELGNTEEKAILENKRTDILSHFNPMVGRNGRPRKASDHIEKDRKAVFEAIKRDRNRIANKCPSLATHLENAIKTGSTCSYHPEDQKIPWSF